MSDSEYEGLREATGAELEAYLHEAREREKVHQAQRLFEASRVFAVVACSTDDTPGPKGKA